MKSKHYHLVDPTGVVVFSGSKRDATKKRKSAVGKHFIGMSPSKTVGDKWISDCSD